MSKTETTVRISKHGPIKLESSEKALLLCRFLYSIHEQAVPGAMWFEVIGALGELRKHDWGAEYGLADPVTTRLAVGRAASALLAVMGMHSREGGRLMNPTLWAHPLRAPNNVAVNISDINSKLAEVMGDLAVRARQIGLNADPKGADVCRIGTLELLRATLYEPQARHAESMFIGLDLYTYAAIFKLSLKECVEAYAETRRSKLIKNGVKYGREEDDPAQAA